jgi:hypothetical protein
VHVGALRHCAAERHQRDGVFNLSVCQPSFTANGSPAAGCHLRWQVRNTVSSAVVASNAAIDLAFQ